jgi:hypothetical protein
MNSIHKHLESQKESRKSANPPIKALQTAFGGSGTAFSL